MKKLVRTGMAVLLVWGILFTNIFHSITVYAKDSDTAAISEEIAAGEKMAAEFGKLNYLYIDKPFMEKPGEQGIVVSFGNGTEEISDMSVLLQRKDGKSFEAKLDRKEAETYLLKYTFEPGDEGVYQAMELRYTMGEKQYTLALTDIGVDAKFGIGQEYPGYSEDGSVVTRDGIVDEDLSMSIVQVEDGQEVTSEEIEAAIQASEDGTAIESFSNQGSTRSGELVVVIDPGHGGTEPGAVANGIIEKDVNLKIAKYCRDELQQYSGVKVYMTREDDRNVGLGERVDIASSYGANLFLCIHVNSSVDSSPKGAEVYYPNSSYNSTIHQDGKNTAQNILNQLVALGLDNRGILVRDATDGDRYPDGSMGDYYTVINESKRAGFPGLIVEHAFLSNPSEAERLKQDSFLEQLGKADATGVAQAYGLTKGPSGPPAVGVENIDRLTGTAQIKYSNVGAGTLIAIWSDVKGQDDLVWYNLSGNSGILKFDMKNHKNSIGTYQVNMYSRNADGSAGEMLGTASFSMERPPMQYKDVPTDSWYYDVAKEAYERGLLTGMDAYTFAPSVKLTRGMMATILWRNAGEPSIDYAPIFPDLANGQFYTTAIMWANANGVMSGYEDGTCGPNDLITREQFATLMFRYAKNLNLDTEQSADLGIFPDGLSTSEFAKSAMSWCVANKLFTGNGDGTLAPQGLTDRASAAAVIVRFVRNFNL